MRTPQPMHPHEIRIIRLNRSGINNLLHSIIMETGHRMFKLSHKKQNIRNAYIDWYFDESCCQIVIYAYKGDVIDKEIVRAYIDKIQVEAVNSFYTNTADKNIFLSASIMLPIRDGSDAIRKESQDNIYYNTINKLLCLFRIKDNRLKKNEVRIIRASTAAIHELLWEFFVQNGNMIMQIPKNDGDNVIFDMAIDERLRDLMFYAVNLNVVTNINYERLDAYCRKNITFENGQNIKGRQFLLNYVSLVLTESFFEK